MKCQEAVSMIDPFLNDRLSFKETKAFIQHIEHCDECRDELEVRYMVQVSAEAFGENDLKSYDLSHLLQDKLENRKKWLRRMSLLQYFLLVLILSVLAFMIVYFFIL